MRYTNRHDYISYLKRHNNDGNNLGHNVSRKKTLFFLKEDYPLAMLGKNLGDTTSCHHEVGSLSTSYRYLIRIGHVKQNPCQTFQ